jgi:hypothetical protein
MSELTARKPARIQITFTPVAQLPDEDPIISADNPRPSWMLTATEGRGEPIGTWEVWHPHHLTAGDYSTLIAKELARNAGPSDGDPMKGHRELFGYGVPDMPTDLYDRLSPNQMLAIERKIWQRPGETKAEAAERKADAANPPVGAGTSASPSPAPPAGSDGVTRA